MSDDLAALAADLRVLHETWGEAVARAALAEKSATLPADQHQRLEALVFFGDTQTRDVTIGNISRGDQITAGGDAAKGIVTLNGAVRSTGANIGVNQGTVQLFFGGRPPEDGARMLNAYLDALCERYRPLALGRLLTRERTGDERTAAPALPLRAVYTALATDARLPRERFTLTREELDKALTAADPDQLPPDRLRFPVADLDGMQELTALLRADRPETQARSLRDLYGSLRRVTPRASGRNKQERVVGQWYEPELAVEALAAVRSRVVLLGDPGSGKSTVLRYLVVCIAEALLAGMTVGPADLRGWAGRPLPVPIFCPLGTVAKELDASPHGDLDRLVAAVLRPLYGAGGLREGMRETLLRAWHGGGVLLCFDGLDEVSGTPEPTQEGSLSRRERLAEAIRCLALEVGDSCVVVTCRTKPYQHDRAWQMPDPWQTRRIEPFAFGQVRFFVEHWYAQSCAVEGAKLTAEAGQAKAAELVRAIPAKPGLRDVCASPLLLTMVVLLHFNQKQLPDERAEVYEELVGLLLDRWEWVRSSEKEHVHLVTFGERLALPQLRARDLRAAVNEIAYEAHRTALDGRGVIAEALIYDLLAPRFRNAISPERPASVRRGVWSVKVDTFLDLLVRESGLVQPDGDDTYVLPHLTFQEYLAACHLAEVEDVELAYARWAEGGDRWREPLLLLMGGLRMQTKHKQALEWLTLLLDDAVGTVEKSVAQRQRDAVLAAACYRELGSRRYLQDRWHVRKVNTLEERLRHALLNAIETPVPETLLPLRLEAGEALGHLGDPRYPVAAAHWQAELGRLSRDFGHPAGYFCYVPEDAYPIGGWEAEEQPAGLQIPAFWLARFPITVAQYAPFVAEGYGKDAERWWTPQGWQWKTEQQRTEPWGWNDPEYSGTNQPVIGITWYEATAFCAWLTKQVDAKDYVVRLPTEAEWEVAASVDSSPVRRLYPWGDEEPTPERAIYDASKLSRPAPVGCCPAGAAACGALDMAGNVWEWTASSYEGYPAQSDTQIKDFTIGKYDVPLRGGSYWDNSTNVRCGARDRYHPVNAVGFFNLGVRVCLAPRSR